MNIFVLEDDFIQQSRMETTIKELTRKNHMSPKKFEIFGKANQLLEAIEEKGAHQLFFLDIEIKTDELKGLEVAKQIRAIDPYAIIVFVTTHTEFMPLTFRYQVAALDFIDKELSQEEFEKRIETTLIYADQKDGKTLAEESFYFKSKYAQVQYPFNEVYYIETSPRPHRVILYTKNDRMEFTASLSEILKQNNHLIQCHRSFAINPANVLKVDRQERVIYFPNGTSCLISRQKINTIVKIVEDLH
ncbi:response regulator transcription factor [Streptococcus sp. CSL10205-OR2]|uniref:response regulator transcription factor n=1 Tax=Streptococcus sp. CSL10205-OR2 TaxID=2980558 RepID=UPI0021D8BFB0|nr:response regulator transcription factor [Streptococcus sp. CSL10205-OR2]MCU9534314.1 response regulator transcription factor [Streptococcus sp. CSL10205-OR2]